MWLPDIYLYTVCPHFQQHTAQRHSWSQHHQDDAKLDIIEDHFDREQHTTWHSKPFVLLLSCISNDVELCFILNMPVPITPVLLLSGSVTCSCSTLVADLLWSTSEKKMLMASQYPPESLNQLCLVEACLPSGAACGGMGEGQL